MPARFCKEPRKVLAREAVRGFDAKSQEFVKTVSIDEDSMVRNGSERASVRLGASSAALQARLSRAKRAFVTRNADLGLANGLSSEGSPRSGDLVLATVLDVGQHTRLELVSGRRAQLYRGDEIVCAYGARYATDQFDAGVPATHATCDLVAAGGIAAVTRARHANVRKATLIRPVGRLLDLRGDTLNLDRFGIGSPVVPAPRRSLIVVVGTSMNAGKTTVMSNLIRGLTRAGVRVGACKVTGTGSGGDLWSMLDAGADRALDFTDSGFASTAGADLGALDRAAAALVSTLEASGVDVVVAEIADGLFQRETAALLSPPLAFASRIDAVFLAAGDAMGAQAGAAWLHSRNLPLKAVTGVITSSPLAVREAQGVMRYEVIETSKLSEVTSAARLCLGAHAKLARSVGP